MLFYFTPTSPSDELDDILLDNTDTVTTENKGISRKKKFLIGAVGLCVILAIVLGVVFGSQK